MPRTVVRPQEYAVTCNGRLLVSLVFIAIGCSVSGCGGGGGGGASPSTPQPPEIPADPGDDPPTVTYTGNTSPATLTQAPTSSGRMAEFCPITPELE